MAGDPYFASVVLLCHFEGADGATGAGVILDSSSRVHAVGGSNPLTIAQKKFGTSSLNNIGGSTTSGDSADWDFGAGQFTVEVWARPTSAISGLDVVAAQYAGSQIAWYLGFNGNTLVFGYSTDGTSITTVSAAYTVTQNTWVHVAADRDAGNVVRVYADGVVIASASAAATFFNSAGLFTIGDTSNGVNSMIGQLDDLRITKGVARYAGAFTPPTAAFPDVFGPGDAAAGAGGVARFMMRRRTMRMINDNPLLAKKLGIRGKLQALD